MLGSLWFGFLGQLPDAYLRVRKWSGCVVGVQVLHLALNITFNVSLLVAGWGILAVLVGNLATNVVMSLVRLALMAFSRGGYRFDTGTARKLLKFGALLAVTSLFSLGMHQADRYFLRAYLDIGDVGIYSVAYSIGQAVTTVFLMSFGSIWNVVVYEIADRPDAKQVYSFVFEYFCYALLLTILGLSLFARPLIAFMASPEFAPAADLIPVIALAYFFFSLHLHFKTPAIVANRTTQLLPAVILAFAVNVAANMTLIPTFGGAGAAWSSVASFATFSFGGLVLYRRIDKIPYSFARIALVFVMYCAVYLVSRPIIAAQSNELTKFAISAGLWLACAVLVLHPLFKYVPRLFSRQSTPDAEISGELLTG